MSLVFVETDVVANCDAIIACSGATITTKNMAKEGVVSGTPGTTGINVAFPGSSSGQAGIMFQSPVGSPGFVNWSAGSWIVRINHTATVDAGVTWEDTYVCRVNVACGTVGTVGSLLAQAIDVTSLGVYSMTVSGGASSGAASDMFYIVCVFDNANASPRTLVWTPDQDIDTPLVAPSVSDPLITLARAGAVAPVLQGDPLELFLT